MSRRVDQAPGKQCNQVASLTQPAVVKSRRGLQSALGSPATNETVGEREHPQMR